MNLSPAPATAYEQRALGLHTWQSSGPDNGEAPGVEPSPSRPRLCWSDFNTVLCVARHGSVARASTALAVTHSTLLRKLATIESRLNARLFERANGRYFLTPAGEEIARAAASFESISREAESRVLGLDSKPSGQVRVAVADIVMDHLLPPILSQFALAFPEVEIQLNTSQDQASVMRREADVAIQMGHEVQQSLIGRRLGEVEFKVYSLCRPGLEVEARPVDELSAERRWISFEADDKAPWISKWFHQHVPDTSVALRVDGFGHALAMVKAGLGIAVLPVFLETIHPELHPLTPAITELRMPLWAMTHPDLRNSMKVRVLMQAFGGALSHALRVS